MSTGAAKQTWPSSVTGNAIAELAAERDALRSRVERLERELRETQALLAQSLAREAASLRSTARPHSEEPLAAASERTVRARGASEPLPSAQAGAGWPPSPTADEWIRPDPAPPTAGVAPPTMASADGLDFGAVSRLSPEALDALPYGLVTLDAEGRVIGYNDTESRLVGLPRERVIGKNFFVDVAPCARVREFEGRFRELVRDPVGVRVQTFDFVFRFPRQEQRVTIVMTPARTRGQYHLAMLRRAVQARG